MAKNYAVIRNGQLEGLAKGIDLDPDFEQLELANGVEYRELDPSLEDEEDLELVNDVVQVKASEKARKQGKKAAMDRLKALDLKGPPLAVDQTLKDLVEALLK